MLLASLRFCLATFITFADDHCLRSIDVQTVNFVKLVLYVLFNSFAFFLYSATASLAPGSLPSSIGSLPITFSITSIVITISTMLMARQIAGF